MIPWMLETPQEEEDIFFSYWGTKISKTDSPRTAFLQPSPIEQKWIEEKKEYMSLGRAWLEYTGIPAMVVGGLGAFGVNAGFQASQVRSGTSIFSAARFGFGLALLLETFIGTAIFATALTILDTQDLHAGGLTNEPLGQTLFEHSPTGLIVDNPSIPSFWKMLWLSGQ